MKKKTVTKLWKNIFASIRDYEVEDAIKLGGMELTYDKQKMFLSPEDLKKLKPMGKKIKSKTGGKDYHLMNVLFDKSEKDLD
tara:strand:- start:87 stop:332 length:246 start_codon:yes stop_codon:yes gene_type:complete